VAVLVDLDSMGDAELLRLAALPAVTESACRLRREAATVWFQRGRSVVDGWRWGRWPLLVWFAKQERIMSREELTAALTRVREA
jgi:hypothetical protein